MEMIKAQHEFASLAVDQKFIEFSSIQPSILDSSGYSFTRIPEKKRKEVIQDLIKS